jgi:Rad3-related DNA helicase
MGVNKRLYPEGRLTPQVAGEIPQEPVLPPPPTFGLSHRFDTWRPGQDQATSSIVTSDSRFNALVCPTGFGKSLMYICAAILSGERTLVLTSTNPLSHQLMEDFGDLCVQVKGKANYRCRKIGYGVTCDKGPCQYGIGCQWKDGGCPYFDQIRRAMGAQIVITNYAFWIYNNKARLVADEQDSPIGDFGLLVCDEAHDCPDKVADAFTVRFSRRSDVEKYLLQGYGWEADDQKVLTWARQARVEAHRIYQEAKREDRLERAFQATGAKRKLKEVIEMIAGDTGGFEAGNPSGSNIVIVPEKKWGVLRVALAWPFDRAREVLFRDIPKIVFTSATVRPKTTGMLGVKEGECRLMEYPHIIPQERRVLYHIPTIRLNYRTTDVEMRTWLTRIDQIMKGRLDRNGIIHTVSYARRDLLLKRSKYVDRMVTHNRKDASEVIERFKEGRGRTLVSPSVTTGYDFPDDTARWQIIGKIAYPDTSDPITKERCKRDSEYGPYVAMQTLVQTVGRIVRGAEDWGESFIIDDNVKWFIYKYGMFAPDWFTGSYKGLTGVPSPMEF